MFIVFYISFVTNLETFLFIAKTTQRQTAIMVITLHRQPFRRHVHFDDIAFRLWGSNGL